MPYRCLHACRQHAGTMVFSAYTIMRRLCMPRSELKTQTSKLKKPGQLFETVKTDSRNSALGKNRCCLKSRSGNTGKRACIVAARATSTGKRSNGSMLPETFAGLSRQILSPTGASCVRPLGWLTAVVATPRIQMRCSPSPHGHHLSYVPYRCEQLAPFRRTVRTLAGGSTGHGTGVYGTIVSEIHPPPRMIWVMGRFTSNDSSVITHAVNRRRRQQSRLGQQQLIQ